MIQHLGKYKKYAVLLARMYRVEPDKKWLRQKV
jgi:hypothetical protein